MLGRVLAVMNAGGCFNKHEACRIREISDEERRRTLEETWPFGPERMPELVINDRQSLIRNLNIGEEEDR
jgi:hypothetical protein